MAQAYALELSEAVVIDFHGAINNADRAVRFSLPLLAAGTLEANGYVLIRRADGVVLEVSSEETLTGIWSSRGRSYPTSRPFVCVS
jgi:hypothetical protein